MYASRTTQLIVGVFGLVGLLALAILSMRLGRVELFAAPSYMLYANFDNISGLKAGDQVQIAGVDVGKVASIELRDNRARVALRIKQGVTIDDDAIAAIKTSGIIGDKYVSIALGPSDQTLHDTEVIRHTQSAFVLEDAIGQLINSSGPSGSSSGGNSARAACDGTKSAHSSNIAANPIADPPETGTNRQKGAK
jgi:phospholipid/cholesterol/gamma-HCH transport system substrate-binding protein